MTKANANNAVEEETGGKWRSLRSSLMNLMNTLDYDPREHADAVVDQLGESVSQLEARLSVLEQQGRRVPVAETTELDERA